MSTRSAKVNFLLDLAFRVPPLLEKIDSATSTTKPRTSDTSALTENILKLKKTFEFWLKSFTQLDQQHQQQPQSPTHKPKNPSIHDLTCESLCRICLLLLVSGLADLSKNPLAPHPPSDRPNPTPYALSLRKTTLLFTKSTKIPIVKARGVSGALHFLHAFYTRTGDDEGAQWCQQVKESVCAEAPYLSWDLMLPWSLLTLYAIPLRTAEVDEGTARRAVI